MTLLDAPQFNVRRERRNRNLLLAGIIILLIGAIAVVSWAAEIPWQIWHWPSDHRVNQFLGTVESGDLQKAYGLWNNDPNWQQHPDQYKAYDFTALPEGLGFGQRLRSDQVARDHRGTQGRQWRRDGREHQRRQDADLPPR